MSSVIYLDYAAATPISAAVLEATNKVARQLFYNPSANHAGAQAAKQLLEDSRRQLARLLSVQASQLVFTAGATEANNLAIAGYKAAVGGLVACLTIDHDSIGNQADINLGVDPTTGQVDLKALAKLPDTVSLISLAGTNSELGVIQPLAQIRKLLKQIRSDRQAAGVDRPLKLHIDASQMAGHQTIDPHRLGADLLTINGAKIYGPQQSAVLFIADGVTLKPLFSGGSQEAGLRPGTESLVASHGLVVAYQQAVDGQSKLNRNLELCQSQFETSLKQLAAQVVLPQKLRSPHISTLIFPSQDNERLAYQLSQQDIYVGLGSACHASDHQPSASLLALGYSPSEAKSSLRFSYGRDTSLKQLKRVRTVLGRLLD